MIKSSSLYSYDKSGNLKEKSGAYGDKTAYSYNLDSKLTDTTLLYRKDITSSNNEIEYVASNEYGLNGNLIKKKNGKRIEVVNVGSDEQSFALQVVEAPYFGVVAGIYTEGVNVLATKVVKENETDSDILKANIPISIYETGLREALTNIKITVNDLTLLKCRK